MPKKKILLKSYVAFFPHLQNLATVGGYLSQTIRQTVFGGLFYLFRHTSGLALALSHGIIDAKDKALKGQPQGKLERNCCYAVTPPLPLKGLSDILLHSPLNNTNICHHF